MKIFAMNDCDWMAAETLEAATAAYLVEYSGGLPADEALDSPRELTDEEMGLLLVMDESGVRVGTFREELDKLVAAGAVFPRMFASTEY